MNGARAMMAMLEAIRVAHLSRASPVRFPAANASASRSRGRW